MNYIIILVLKSLPLVNPRSYFRWLIDFLTKIIKIKITLQIYLWSLFLEYIFVCYQIDITIVLWLISHGSFQVPCSLDIRLHIILLIPTHGCVDIFVICIVLPVGWLILREVVHIIKARSCITLLVFSLQKLIKTEEIIVFVCWLLIYVYFPKTIEIHFLFNVGGRDTSHTHKLLLVVFNLFIFIIWSSKLKIIKGYIFSKIGSLLLI